MSALLASLHGGEMQHLKSGSLREEVAGRDYAHHDCGAHRSGAGGAAVVPYTRTPEALSCHRPGA